MARPFQSSNPTCLNLLAGIVQPLGNEFHGCTLHKELGGMGVVIERPVKHLGEALVRDLTSNGFSQA